MCDWLVRPRQTGLAGQTPSDGTVCDCLVRPRQTGLCVTAWSDPRRTWPRFITCDAMSESSGNQSAARWLQPWPWPGPHCVQWYRPCSRGWPGPTAARADNNETLITQLCATVRCPAQHGPSPPPRQASFHRKMTECHPNDAPVMTVICARPAVVGAGWRCTGGPVWEPPAVLGRAPVAGPVRLCQLAGLSTAWGMFFRYL